MKRFTWMPKREGHVPTGHFERSENDGKTWSQVTWRDVQRTLGYGVAETLRREPSQARPYPQSRWGTLYRWVPAVSAEANRAG